MAEPEEINNGLRVSLRRGASAARLRRYTPELIRAISPPHDGVTESKRALETETLIRRATANIGGQHGQALIVLLGLEPGTVGDTLTSRRNRAARTCGIHPATWRRPGHEEALLWDLAMEVYRLTGG